MTWTPPLVLVAISSVETADLLGALLRERGLAVYTVPVAVPLAAFIADTLAYAGSTAVDVLVVDLVRLTTDGRRPLRVPLVVVEPDVLVAEVCAEVLEALGMSPPDAGGPRIRQHPI